MLRNQNLKVLEFKHYNIITNYIISVNNSHVILDDDDVPKESANIMYIRHRHWNLCQLVHHLDGSLTGLYACFYVVNVFFMWNHLMSLVSPPLNLYLYTIYQIWSLFRQILRFLLVTCYAVSVSKQLKRPLRKVMGLPNTYYGQESRRLQVRNGKITQSHKI